MTFPAYAVLLRTDVHSGNGYVERSYWDVHHIEPVVGDEPGAAFKAYAKAINVFLSCRQHIERASAYLVCMNLIAGPDTDLGELEGGNQSET